MSEEPEQRATLPEVRGSGLGVAGMRLFGLLLLVVVCAASGFVGLLAVGPLAGIGGAVGGGLLYAKIGPRPIPGLLPGLLAMVVVMFAGCAFVASIAGLAGELAG